MPAKKSFFNGFIPAILWWLVVLILMCTPGYNLPKLGNWTELISLDKLIHVIIFALMAYLFMRPIAKNNSQPTIKKRYCVKIAIVISIWGLTTEFIQQFWVAGRSFDLWDWVADTIGAVVAFYLSKKYFTVA